MKWTYELDSLNRFKYLKAATEEDVNIVEIEKENFRKVICGFHGLKDGKIIEIGFTDKEKQLMRKHNLPDMVKQLKNNLENTDYQIIKCYEAFMRQQPLPYNLEELSAQRDAWRAEINELEQELAKLE